MKIITIQDIENAQGEPEKINEYLQQFREEQPALSGAIDTILKQLSPDESDYYLIYLQIIWRAIKQAGENLPIPAKKFVEKRKANQHTLERLKSAAAGTLDINKLLAEMEYMISHYHQEPLLRFLFSAIRSHREIREPIQDVIILDLKSIIDCFDDTEKL